MSVGKIKEFDMENGNWTLYCERVNMYFKANAIKDELKLATLISVVGDGVYELMTTLANPKKPTELTFEEVVKLVREHLQPTPSVWAERYRFRQKRQDSGENIMQYVAALKRMTKFCNFGATLNDNLRDQFVCGVNSELIRQRLFAEPPTLTMTQAVTLATSLEAAERDAAAVEAPAAAAAVAPVHAIRATSSRGGRGRASPRGSARGASTTPASGGGPCEACGGSHCTQGCRYIDFVCSVCGNKGHLRRVCPYKKTKKASHPGPRDGKKSNQQAYYVSQSDVEEASSSGEEEVEEPMFQMGLSDYKPVSLTLLVNNHELNMEVDTGTACSCISKTTYDLLFKNCKIEKSNVIFKFYDGSKVIPLGLIKVNVQYMNVSRVLDLYIVDKGVTSLVGRQWLAELNIRVKVEKCNVFNMNCNELRNILDRHKNVLSGGLGRYTGGEAVLRVRAGATPVFCRARPVPFALRERVDAELDTMLHEGVIEPVDCSDWATPLVLVRKPDGALRVCADFKVTLNPVLMVDRYPLPKIDDLLSNLAGGQEFSKIDLSQAYNQICLSQDSKAFTVVNTHRGLFRYNRLVYGLSSSSGIFQRIMSSAWASHLESLEMLFQKLEDAGLKVKRSKCTFLAKEVKYLGFIVDRHGIRADESKLIAIKNMPVPQNVPELRSFLGMVNFYARFVPRLSDLLHPLHELLVKGKRWEWNSERSKTFEAVKQLLMSKTVLAHYDPAKELIMTCDASSRGVGGVLSQRDARGEERAIAYVSRKLTSAEQGYSQIHREALAIVYCIKKFHQYIYGRRFRLKTDHKPLVSLFGPNKGIPTMAASRMQRWALIISAYEFDIEYVNTASNGADVLSRLPIEDDDKYEPPEQTYLHFASNAMMLDNVAIRRATARDPLLSRVCGYIENGWPNEFEIEQLKPYHNRREELYIELGCVMWGHRLVVPEACRQWVLRELHDSHMGIVKTKAYARSYVWWPGLDEAVEAVCRACTTCAALATAPPAVVPASWKWPQRPYERIHLDFLQIEGSTYLVIVDARSKWIEAYKMSRTTAEATIAKLRESWSRWGLPRQVVSDNGPPFSSKEFKDFLNSNGVEQTLTAPYHPSSNGAAENAVKTIKNVIKKALRENKNVEHAIQTFLLTYHNTPHCTTGESPARLLQGRKLRTRLDVIKPDSTQSLKAKNNENVNKTAPSRGFQTGDSVWFRNFGHKTKWLEGLIHQRLGKSNYSVATNDGSQTHHRHIDQLKRRSRSSLMFPEPPESDKCGSSGVAQSAGTSSSEHERARRDARASTGGNEWMTESPPPATVSPPSSPPVPLAVPPIAPPSVNKRAEPLPKSHVPEQTPSTLSNLELDKRIRKPVKHYGFEFD